MVLSPIVTRPAAQQQHRVSWGGGRGGPGHYVVTSTLIEVELDCDNIYNWSERSACAALRHCSETKCPLYLVYFFFLSFCATYFSPRRVYRRVQKFCMGF